MSPKVLVIDDDPQIVKQVTWALSGEFEVLAASDRPSAIEVFRKERPPVVLLDLGLPPRPREADEGLAALEEILAEEPLAKVIVVSGNSDRGNAARAVENGAHDMFPKPIEIGELKVVIRRALARRELEMESLDGRRVAGQESCEGMIGSSPGMKLVFTTVRKVAPAQVPVLILGESGTGKELVARAIHNLSPRRDGPFVAINCGAIPENLLESELFGHEKGAFTGATAQRRGKLEYAHGGTLFLDEVGELAQPLQVKLLRFLQEKTLERVGGREPIRVDARVLAATNQDLEKSASAGRFRQDLFFRLAVVKMSLPPLRDRGDDVVALAERFAAAASLDLKLPPRKLSRQAVDAIVRHPWPGNVRELQNRIQRAVVIADGPAIGACELELSPGAPRSQPAATSLKVAREGLERELVAKALAESKGNITKASRALGISRPTLYELMAKFGM